MSQNISWAIPECDDFNVSWIITACSAWWTLIHQRWERTATRCHFTCSFTLRFIQTRWTMATMSAIYYYSAVIWSIALLSWRDLGGHCVFGALGVLKSTGEGKKKTGTAHDSILQSYSLTRSDKHSLKDDYSFQLDIGHCDQINAVQNVFWRSVIIDLITCGPSQIDFHTNNYRKVFFKKMWW